MDGDIQTLEKMRDDLLRQIRADLTLTDQAPTDPVLPQRRTRRKKATTLTDDQLAAVPDYNPGRGGIRIDD